VKRLKYRYIIWDWNGTLLNDALVCRSVMNTLLHRRNLPVMSARRYESIFDFPVSVYYERLGFDFRQESFESLGSEFIAAYESKKSGCRLQPHARGILSKFHRTEIKQSILSAYRHDTLITILKDKNLHQYFDWVLGADDHYARGKAAQGAVLLNKISPPVNSTVMIGDTVHDFEVAGQIGVDCVLVYSGHQERKRLESCNCPVFDDLSGVDKWLTGTN